MVIKLQLVSKVVLRIKAQTWANTVNVSSLISGCFHTGRFANVTALQAKFERETLSEVTQFGFLWKQLEKPVPSGLEPCGLSTKLGFPFQLSFGIWSCSLHLQIHPTETFAEFLQQSFVPLHFSACIMLLWRMCGPEERHNPGKFYTAIVLQIRPQIVSAGERSS